jgi:glycosyltransferase involved in cell wall biosynthesis
MRARGTAVLLGRRGGSAVRIAHVVSSYHPRIGGVETHVRRIAQGCAAAGDEVTVLTHRCGDEVSEESVGAVRVLRFPLTVRSATYPFSLALFRFLREHAADFDLVHSHSYHTLAGQAALRSRLPFVFTPHYHGTGHTALRAALHQLYRPVGARQFAAADAIICVSQAERALVAKDFPRAAGKVTTIPNGTDRRLAMPGGAAMPGEAAMPGRDQAVRLLLTAGRLERYKNVDLVIKAFRALPRPARLVIVGDGPDRARLEEAARGGEPSWPVRFAGRIPDPELDGLLAAATVVASASDHEAFGLMLADGLAAGARVVASGIPAHREVGQLAGASAAISFVDPRDTRQFTAELDAALDRGRCHAGPAGLPTWSEVAGQTHELYARVAASRYPLRRRELA